jgi:hypothetical protein
VPRKPTPKNAAPFPKKPQGGVKPPKPPRTIGKGVFAAFRDEDLGWQAAVEAGDMLDGATVDVGFFANEPNHRRAGRRRTFDGKIKKNISVLQRAAFNQFGVPESNIPPRPFLTVGFDDWLDNKGMAQLTSFFAVDPSDAGPGLVEALRKAGGAMQDGMIESARGWTSPPNAKLTVKLKGFNDPLVESGEMAVSPVVRYSLKGGGRRKAKAEAKLAPKNPRVKKSRTTGRRAGRPSALFSKRRASRASLFSALRGEGARNAAMRAPSKSKSKKATSTRFRARTRFRPGGSGKRPRR